MTTIPRTNLFARYGLAALAVAVAALFQELTWPLLRPTPTTLFFFSVALAARLGGLGPGILATALAATACSRFLQPGNFLGVADSVVLSVAAFAVVAVLIAVLGEARTRAERRNAEILERVTDAFYAVDRDWRFTYLNPRAAEFFGLPAPELLGTRFWERHGKTDSAVGRLLREVVDRGEPTSFEAASNARPGRWVEVHAYPSDDGLSVYFRDITARKEAERELRRREEELRLITDAAPALIAYIDANLCYRYVNVRYEDWFGRPRSEVEGKHVAEILGEEAVRTLRVYFEQALRGEAVRVEQWAPYRTGGRHIDASYVPDPDEAGGTRGFFVLVHDITERKAAERRQALLVEAGRILGSSLDYEATLADVARLVVPGFSDWCALDLIDDSGRILRIAAEHGDPPDAEPPNAPRRRDPPRPGDPWGVPKVLRTGTPELFPRIDDAALERAALDATHLATLRGLGLRSAIIVPLIARGRTLGALTLVLTESPRNFGEEDLAVAQELASRAALAVDNARLFSEVEAASRRLEEALALHRAVEQRLTLLVRASDSLSSSLDLGSVLGAILELSGKLVEADAYAIWRHDPASRTWGIVHASGLSQEYRDATIRMADSTPTMPESPIVAEDVLDSPPLAGRTGPYEAEGIRSLMATPLVVRRVTAGTLVFYYRSPRRFTEVEVRVATALANLSASAIASAELFGELREADRRKDEFLAMLSHELRNPLAAVTSAAALIRRRAPEGDDLGLAAEVIARQTRHLARLVDDLLDVSRITQGKIRLDSRPVDVAPALDQAVEAVRPMAEERGHRLELDYEPGLLSVEADPTRLEQMVVNLLTNAVKYTGDGGLIRLSARLDGDEVVIAVVDDGPGLPPDQLPRMFELFAQGDRSLARSEGGLGIGLTLVRSLAELHGGRALALSDGPGTGCEFRIVLPSLGKPAVPEARGPAAAPSAGRPGDGVVLLVDDNRDAATVLARLLEFQGFRVELAHDGPTAVELGLRIRPHVVLLDIGLPGLDGFEVAALLRGGGLRDAVIIALSGYGRQEDVRRSRDSGFDHHLTKPVDHDRLLELLCPPSPAPS